MGSNRTLVGFYFGRARPAGSTDRGRSRSVLRSRSLAYLRPSTTRISGFLPTSASACLPRTTPITGARQEPFSAEASRRPCHEQPRSAQTPPAAVAALQPLVHVHVLGL